MKTLEQRVAELEAHADRIGTGFGIFVVSVLWSVMLTILLLTKLGLLHP